jgi:hypothetical protein
MSTVTSSGNKISNSGSNNNSSGGGADADAVLQAPFRVVWQLLFGPDTDHYHNILKLQDLKGMSF